MVVDFTFIDMWHWMTTVQTCTSIEYMIRVHIFCILNTHCTNPRSLLRASHCIASCFLLLFLVIVIIHKFSTFKWLYIKLLNLCKMEKGGTNKHFIHSSSFWGPCASWACHELCVGFEEWSVWLLLAQVRGHLFLSSNNVTGARYLLVL